MELKSWLADAILVVHLGIVGFVVVGTILIWVGHFCSWQFVRRMAWRVIHLAIMVIVAGQALLGIQCPLTTWENSLRREVNSVAMQETGIYERTFVQRHLDPILHVDVASLTVVYVLLVVVLVAGFVWVRPERRASPVPEEPASAEAEESPPGEE